MKPYAADLWFDELDGTPESQIGKPLSSAHPNVVCVACVFEPAEDPRRLAYTAAKPRGGQPREAGPPRGKWRLRYKPRLVAKGELKPAVPVTKGELKPTTKVPVTNSEPVATHSPPEAPPEK